MNKKKEVVLNKDEIYCNCNDNIFFEKKIFKLLFFVFILFLLFFACISAQKMIKERNLVSTSEREANYININKTGIVYAIPNVGLINLNSTTNAKTIAEALKQNNEKISRVIAFLKSQGISSEDIKTANFNVYPNYEWIKTEDTFSNVITEGQRKIAGYEVSQTTEVKIRDINKVGLVIDGAIEAGINNVSNLSFVVDDEDAAKAQAREKAISAAKIEAQSVADKLGVKLGSVSNYNESFSIPVYGSAVSYEKAMDSSLPTTVDIGKNKIEVTVNISFKIN
ncbi:MAG: SIMPL domain-containing protein [Candidatus Pacebacteria bacterium]|nr:SIMPL domain-containing protein [Candidatus Paceibacterota bacterium]